MRRAFTRRFLQERQILASLHYPGIAHLLDAGETSQGKPYLVMDYVDGVPIDTYAQRLDLPGKLRLSLKVSDAVSYATSRCSQPLWRPSPIPPATWPTPPRSR